MFEGLNRWLSGKEIEKAESLKADKKVVPLKADRLKHLDQKSGFEQWVKESGAEGEDLDGTEEFVYQGGEVPDRHGLHLVRPEDESGDLLNGGMLEMSAANSAIEAGAEADVETEIPDPTEIAFSDKLKALENQRLAVEADRLAYRTAKAKVKKVA